MQEAKNIPNVMNSWYVLISAPRMYRGAVSAGDDQYTNDLQYRVTYLDT
jgi:hypothetical protein